MPNVGDILQSKTGKQYKLIKQLGKGGEGTVYTTSDPNLVIKVYHPNKVTKEIERKLLCMLQHPIDPMAGIGKLLIAWPQDVVYQNNTFVGYAMPFVKDTHPIYIVCRNNEKHVRDCHEVFPNYDWRYSLMVAYHLAWAVAYIHKHGYVIGDMNSNNIVVHGDGTITILDVDSFDITDPVTKEHFPCTVGICEFLAPELQGRNLKTARFSKETDEFALAVHIFILLMNNYHPFTMRDVSAGESFSGNVHTLAKPKQSIPQDQKMINIVNGNCPYIRSIPGYGIPLGAPRFQMLPGRIQTCFRKTFYYTETNAVQQSKLRTNAEIWRYYLYEYFLRTEDDPNTGRKADLIRCNKNPEHFYLRGHGPCELCLAEQRRIDADELLRGKPWAVEILCTTSVQTNQTTSTPIQEGSTAYIHFRVSQGPANRQEALRYSCSSSNGSGGKTLMNDTFGVDERGYISLSNLKPGSHTVVIYDSKDKELARTQFTVLPKSSASSSKSNRGFWSWLFG